MAKPEYSEIEILANSYKKDLGRLRSEVRTLKSTQKTVNPFTGIVSGNYWTQTGMPWVTSEGRKAVLTEWFWQPIRGQPRRVDTNELRQFSQTFWITSCVKTLVDEISSLDWDIVPQDDYEYEQVEDFLLEVKNFLKYPNKNNESFESIIRALLKDILELDAGVLVKVFSIDSYDFDMLEPKSGAPMLRPIGQRKMLEIYARDGASFLKETDKFGFVKGYWQYSYQIPAHPMWFNKDEICYVMENPRSMSTYGFARTQAILDLVKSLYYSTLYNKRFFEEVPLPEGVLSVLDTNEQEMNIFMDWWNREFKGQPHKLGLVNKEVKWNAFTIPNKELEFLETQQQYFKFVITMFGLSPTELGLTDNINRSTSQTQSEITKRKGIRPFLDILEKYFNSDIIPEFGFPGIEFTFIYDDPQEKTIKLNNWRMELEMGIKTINEVRNELGLEPLDWGDTPKNSLNVISSPQNMINGDNQPKPAQQITNEIARENTILDERNQQVHDLYSDANRPVGSFKSMNDEINLLAQRLNVSSETVLQGFEIELEHAETVGGDNNTILRIVEDHLKEDREYYTKLSQIEKRDYREVTPQDQQRQSDIEFAEEYYRILVASGVNPKKAREQAQHMRFRARTKGFNASVDAGQYYREPLQVNHGSKGTITQPQVNPDFFPDELGNDYRTNTDTYRSNNQAVGMMPCPICGRFTMNLNTSADDLNQTQTYRCSNCSALLSQEDIDSLVLDNFTETLEQEPSYEPITKPFWSPKSFNDMTIKDWVGFDFHKSMNEIDEYIDSKEYIQLLQSYLSDLSSDNRSKIRQIIKDGILHGNSITLIRDRIAKLLKDTTRAELITRTELVRVTNHGNAERMKERGFDKAMWLSAPEDGRLCEQCHKLNRKIFPINKAKDMIPLHPNCRCTISEYV